uniref:Semaphorin 6A n=1 Tax=Oryzias sinensis TaxID=183150 RepID=A0A8C7ZVI7_9TELE
MKCPLMFYLVALSLWHLPYFHWHFCVSISSLQKMTWKSRQADVDTCRMKGKHKDECHNFIKVLLQQNEDTLFVCGTNAFNPSCRTYKTETLDAVGEDISGMARCPYDAKHANVALFADGKLYSATVTDFLAIDAVIYRSLGDSPTLRTVKHDSKWLKEPYFVQAVNYGDFIYFFYREIAMEYNTMGKVVFPRVARVCKNDRGGSPRVLEKQWTSFLKSRLNCSIPGDSHFYFNILQAVTEVIHVNGRDVVLATFSTPYNSIPGSAVCAYDMAEVAKTFTGRFKEQKSPDSTWTPFPEERVPKPRPGSCAGSPSMEKYKISNEFPDDTLNFIKMHPLMDEAVPSIANRPWFLKTMVRYRLTRIVVDNEAGPHRNNTVVFLGSEKGIILKFLAKMNNGFLNNSLFLEEVNVYNPDKCSIDGVEDKRIIGMQIDGKNHAMWVAFTSCVVKVPLSRCERHGRCKKSCIASRDPYCAISPGKDSSSALAALLFPPFSYLSSFLSISAPPPPQPYPYIHPPPTPTCRYCCVAPIYRFITAAIQGEGTGGGEGEEGRREATGKETQGMSVIRESYQKGRDQLVPVTLLAIAVILAFAMGAFFSGLIVYCVCDHRRRDIDLAGRKEKDNLHLHSRRGSMNSVTKLTGLFEMQGKEGRPEAILTPLIHNGRLTPNGKMLIKAEQHHLDFAALPTPESTPMQPRRKTSRGSREWERNQNIINACTKDMPSMGSPVISTDLPLRASPGHIPSVVVLPLPQHQHQLQPHLQQSYQHEYVEQPHHSDLNVAHSIMDDQGATLEYKTVKNPCHNLNVDPDGMLPPRVPQREASLTIPPAVPQMGKRLEVHSSVYGLRKGSASAASGSSALKKHNTNSSNSSHLARHHSFRVETPPPAPQRVDSIQMTAQGVSLSRQPGMSSYGSLPRTGVKHLRPDVPPKPSVVSLSTKVKSSESGT